MSRKRNIKKILDKQGLKKEDKEKIAKLGIRGTTSLAKLTQKFKGNLCEKCKQTIGKDICESCLNKNYEIMLKMKELRDKRGI